MPRFPRRDARRTARVPALLLMATLSLAVAPAAHAEVVEEIVAWVNGDIITMSEMESEEQMMLAEAYRRFTGEELDQQVSQMRGELLMQMIDRKILAAQAKQMFDGEKMAEAFYESFKQQQGIESDDEIQAMLETEGMTVESLKDRLVEMFAPDEVMRFEVGSRISIGDRQVREYYDAHLEEFRVELEVALSEIVLLADTPAKRSERRAEIETIRQRLIAGENFATVATAASQAATSEGGGKLGRFKKGELAKALDEVAFELEAGQISDPIEADYGWHLLRVDERVGGSIQPFEEVLEPLRGSLENLEYVEEAQTFLSRARSEADWCVKPGYADRLPEEAGEHACKSL